MKKTIRIIIRAYIYNRISPLVLKLLLAFENTFFVPTAAAYTLQRIK